MDKQLLDSFNNLSVALQNIADALQKNEGRKGPSESMVVDALSKLDITEQIKSIDEGVKQLIQNNAEIIATQKSMMASMQKVEKPEAAYEGLSIEKPIMSINEGVKQLIESNAEVIATQKSMMKSIEDKKTSEAATEGSIQQRILTMVEKIFKKQQEDSEKIDTSTKVSKKRETDTEIITDKKKQTAIKDGIKLVVMIAAGVLAIGLALKIIGQVDFASVVALGIALPLLAIAFEKIAAIDIDLKTLGKALVGLTLLSATMVLVSYFLSNVQTVSIEQGLTVLLIGTTFTILGMSIGKITENIKDVSLKGLVMMPLVLISASAAIAASSYILALVRPIGIAQAFTTIMIGAAFAILSYSISELASNIEGVTPTSLLLLPLVLIAASFSIMASSYFLNQVQPVGFLQILTSIAIAATFAVLSFGLSKIAEAASSIDALGLIMLPFVLIASSFAIMKSSYLLAEVQPVSFLQILTSIAIAATFSVLSFGLAKIAKAASSISPLGLVMLPLVLIAASYAIMESSFALAQVQLITFGQFLTSVGIAIAFIPMAISLVLISKAFEKLSIAKIIATTVALPILFVAMSYAIAYSSEILKTTATVEPGLLFNIILQSITLAAIGIVMGVAIFALDKLGLASPGGIIKTAMAGVAIVLIAGTIALTSQILGLGDYSVYPSLDWTMGSAASILAFGILIAASGAILSATGGAGFVALAFGAIAVLAIAASILAVDFLFGLGKFKKYPSMEWIEGSAKAIGIFGAAYLAIGAAVLATFGAAAVAGAIGAVVVVGIAGTMLAIDAIFNLGSFTRFPSMSWIKGVSSSITGFKDLLVSMGGSLGESKGILDFGKKVFSSIANFVSGVSGATAIMGIAGTIVAVDKVFASGSYNKYPSSEWTRGTIDSLQKFSQVVVNLEGLNTASAIQAASGISIIDKIISRGNYTKIISEEYNESLKKAFAALKPLVESAENFDISLIAVAERSAAGIANISNEIARGNYSTNIPNSWATNVLSLFTGYSSIMEVVSDMNPGLISGLTSKVGSVIGEFIGTEEAEKLTPISVAQNIVALSKVISMGNYKPISADFMDSVYQNMKAYLKIIDLLSGQTMSTEILGFSVSMGRGISKIASDYDKLAQGIQKVASAITNIDLEKVTALRALTGSVVLLSLMDSDQFEDVMDALEEKSEILGDLLTKAGGINTELPSVKTASVITPEGPGIKEVLGLMMQIDKKLSAIAASSNNISTYVNEIRSSPSKVGLKR